MAVAAAERTSQGTWCLAHEAFPEVDAEAHERMRLFMGDIAVKKFVAVDIVSESSLQYAAQQAALGSEQDKEVVTKNVSSDVGERLYKVGKQPSALLRINNGKLQQHGRYLTDIHRNTLEHTTLIPEMYRRTEQELKNVLMIEALHPTGVLDDHDVIIFSPSSTKMTEKQKKDYNFFLETESCSIQKISIDNDEVELETAFVAGKATPNSPRHDITAIRELAAKNGVSVTTADGTEIVGLIMLIKKGKLPNGITDVVRIFDDELGGTFYGEAKSRQDYTQHAQECVDRHQQFEGIVSAISEQLVAEASDFKAR